MYEFSNNENVVTAIKQSKILAFVNKRISDEQAIYFATIENIIIDDSGAEKSSKYVVGLFAESI